MSKHYRKENDCLNCGAHLHGKFCSECGQENLELHEPFLHFIGHSIGHYFHFDSKFFHTLKPLFKQPGQLTLDYFEGKRMRYIPPVSMFVFISIVYFLVTPLIQPHKKVTKNDIIIGKDTIENIQSNRFGLSQYPEKTINNSLGFASGIVKERWIKSEMERFEKLPFAQQEEIVDSLKKVAKTKEDQTFIQGLEKLKSDELNGVEKTDINNEDILRHYGSKVFFLLTPIFAFFLMLNFRKNKKYYLEHVIFTLHFQSFAFILFFVVTLVNFVIPNSTIRDTIWLIAFIYLLYYVYKSLVKVYNRKRSTTIRKMITLGILYGFTYLTSIEIIKMIITYLPH